MDAISGGFPSVPALNFVHRIAREQMQILRLTTPKLHPGTEMRLGPFRS
jgi:hypothetical protein